MFAKRKIVVTGGAGLVGQNLVQRLTSRGYDQIVAIDKHPVNTPILAELHPTVKVIQADLVEPGYWEDEFAGADALIINHAQIGAIDEKPFIDNNIIATNNVIAAAKKNAVPYVVHISSSVVNSLAHDFYTESKKVQEKLVIESELPVCVLRPTLMFGWFDRKHLGWLARFMQRMPVFPVPGSGRYKRQPLYAGDFCDIIISCIETPRPGEVFNISGQEQIDYIDLVRTLRTATSSRTRIIRIPYGLFWLLLKIYALVDRKPPFTTNQLEALVIPEIFEVIDWPSVFGVKATALAEAFRQTFQDPVYSKVALEF